MTQNKMGEFISTIRKEKELTQKELAEKIGVTDKAVSKWERGIGYPDISILQELANCLDITVNELLNGSYDEIDDKENATKMNDIALDAIKYSDRVRLSDNMRKIGFIFGIFLIVANFTCIIVNIAIEQKLSWSLYVIGGSVIAWITFVPVLFMKKNKIAYSMIGLFVTTIPYLFLIQYLSMTEGWVIRYGLPIAGLSFIFLMIVLLLFIKLEISKWHVVGFVLLIYVIYDYILVWIIDRHTELYLYQMLEYSAVVFISVIMFVVGYYRKTKRKKVK